MRRVRKLLFSFLVCSLSSSCGKRVSECDALVGQLNETSAAMQAASRSVAKDPEQAAETLAKLASVTRLETEKIARMELTVPELLGFSNGYQKLLRDTADAAAVLAKAAADFRNLEAAAVNHRAVWRSASEELELACEKARRDCLALDRGLTSPPLVTGVEPEAEAEKLEAYANRLASADVKSARVENALESVRKGVTDLAALLRKLAVAKSDHAKATKNLRDAGVKEPALVKSINDFCQAG